MLWVQGPGQEEKETEREERDRAGSQVTGKRAAVHSAGGRGDPYGASLW